LHLLVSIASGEMAPEYAKVNRRLSERIAENYNEPYTFVMNYIRTKIRFTLFPLQQSEVFEVKELYAPPRCHGH